MERFVLILDDQPDYAKALAAYLNESKDFPYRVITEASASEATEYIESGAVGILIAAECFEKSVIKFLCREKLRIFFLRENKEFHDTASVYRYSSAEDFRVRLCKKEEKRKQRILCVFSPFGEAMLEQVGRGIAAGLSENLETLFLPLLPFGLYGREEAVGMSELLYYLLQGEEKLDTFLNDTLSKQHYRTENGAVLLRTVLWESDLRDFSIEQTDRLLRALEEHSGFQVVVFCLFGFQEREQEILNRSSRILVLLRQSKEGRKLYEEFREQLKMAGQQELLLKMTELTLPEDEEGVGLSEMIARGVKIGGEAVAGS